MSRATVRASPLKLDSKLNLEKRKPYWWPCKVRCFINSVLTRTSSTLPKLGKEHSNILQLTSLTSIVNKLYLSLTNTVKCHLWRQWRPSQVQIASNTSKQFLPFMAYQNACTQIMPDISCHMNSTILLSENSHALHPARYTHNQMASLNKWFKR